MPRHVVILASGETERRALPNLLRHLRHEGISVEVRKPPRHRAISSDVAIKIAKACYWSDPRPHKLVVLLDADGRDPQEQLEPLRRRIGRSLDDLDLKVSYAYAQWHLEAWFFADESSLRGHLDRNLGNVDASQPDRIDNPKLHLRNLLAGRLYTAEMAERISRNLDATTITAKSASFARFLDVVRNGGSPN